MRPDASAGLRAAACRPDAGNELIAALHARIHSRDLVVNAAGQRDVRREGNYNEWEAGVSRRVRLPGKATLDRELGTLGNAVTGLGIEHTFHGALQELLVRLAGGARHRRRR